MLYRSNMQLLVCVVLALLAAVASAHVARYDNYKVYRMFPNTESQLKALRQLEDTTVDFDFWRGPSATNAPVEVMVAPHKEPHFHELLDELNLVATPYITNVQRLIDETNMKSLRTKKFGWTAYYQTEEIYAWLDELAAQHPGVVETVIGGSSHEGRDIKGVKVTFKEGNKGVVLEGGIHAREWISPATVTYMLNEILTNEDPAVREIVESYNWYVFPVTNPDGYEYTHTHDRTWRKTRTPYFLCKGADPNRNWDFHWMEGGASVLPCSLTYAGPHAFSEIETKSLSEYLTSIHDNVSAYLGFHSFSQFLLIPYGHTHDYLDNYEELMEIGAKAATSLAHRYGTKYKVGSIPDVIYIASGGSMDWFKGNYKTPITYTYELRDTGRHGFLLPPEQIVPTGEETFDSLVTIMTEAKARGY